MGIFDRFKKPKREESQQFRRGALQRAMLASQKRDYSAALTNTLTAGWNTNPTTADYVTRYTLKALRARSREQFSNNDYARRFIAMGKANVIGDQGVTMQAKAVDGDGRADKMANDAIEREWKRWGMGKNCDLVGQSSLVEIEKMAIASMLMDGEHCVILHRLRRYPYLKLEIIDAELLDVDYHEELRNGNRIKFGIEYNGQGVAVAYYLRELNETGDFYTLNSVTRRRIDARSFIHGYIKERPGQKRGNPQMATSLLRLNMLSGFENASLVNARTSASKMGFFVSPDGQGYQGDDIASNGNLISDAEPGAFEQLPVGVDFKAFEPNYPNGEFADFSKAVLRGIASGLGVGYNSLANDLEGVNFSSLRQGALDERDAWKGLQQWFIEAFCQPVYDAWLEQFLAFGAIQVGRGVLSIDRIEKYSMPSWQPRRWPWVDPLKDVQANIMAIDNGLRSRSDVIRESGRDPADVWAEASAETLLLQELGVNIANSSSDSGDDTEMEQGEGVDIKAMADAYGVGVRAGLITPQREDEDNFRSLAGLPPIGSDVAEDWEASPVRKPITLKMDSEITSLEDDLTDAGMGQDDDERSLRDRYRDAVSKRLIAAQPEYDELLRQLEAE